jgi:hypothetical protein
MMPRILTWSLGLIVYPLMVKGSHSDLYDMVAKYMIAIFSASKVVPLLLSQSRASFIIALIPSQLLYIVSPITYTIKSSTKAIAPLLLLLGELGLLLE